VLLAWADFKTFQNAAKQLKREGRICP